MKICEIKYDYALKNHPQQVALVVQKLRSGKSKWKDAPGEQLTWWYDASIQVNSYSFVELLSGAHHADNQAFESLSLEGKIQDVISRMGVTLRAKTDNRWWANEPIDKESYTIEILQWAEQYIRFFTSIPRISSWSSAPNF